VTAPLVSVIVRSTARPTLPAALASIAAQTHPAVEAVVVAASGPAHPPLAQDVAPHALRFVPGTRPLTRPQAANAGLDAARGAWITFLDDDDLIDPAHVAGLVDAAARTRAKAIASLARVRLRGGGVQNWGQPFALTELYTRNFLHLSTVLFARELVDAGCRFDEAFEIMQDWDFFLQVAQHTPFHSIGQRTFEWRADLGSSGAGGGGNVDDARFARYRDRVYAKWQAARVALARRVEPLLQAAAQAAGQGEDARGAALCEEVLAIARNEPYALDLLGAVRERAGDRDEAIALVSLAATVKPDEPAFVCNLARLVLARGETARARRLAEHALRLRPGYPPAAALVAALPSP
jgi:Glycosyl transferase family 2